MDAARKRFWWMAAGIVLLGALCGATFSAYFRPDMLAAFSQLMAFCASLIP